MSLSVDDLVSSFSASHIGQEAIDLATLHAQLAQTLFASTPAPRQRPRSNTHTCNTPIASSSFSFTHLPARQMTEDICMDEDERMVEELLLPSSPVTAPQTFVAPSAHQQHQHQHQQYQLVSEPSPSPSVFASTDPFYLAAIQQQQQQQASSFFAQGGRPGQNSPFFIRQPVLSPSSASAAASPVSQRDNHHHPLTIDTAHPIFASTAY